jgi:ribosomal protein S18 acetylase RimI-like enzyme
VFGLSIFPDAAAFLERAEGWLLRREDANNLILSLVTARAGGSHAEEPVGLWATVERYGEVVGCAIRTPPHKLLVTDLPPAAAPVLAAGLMDLQPDLPVVLGPVAAARKVAEALVALRGGSLREGMEQGVYRLDRVEVPVGVPGALREATEADVDLTVMWGEGFARDTGIGFPTARDSILGWVRRKALHLWSDEGEPVSVAVAQGHTPHGVRIGYVYTPPTQRGRGYASACVAGLSAKMLAGGCSFCVLYTDLSNPVSNAIYQRVGYRLVDTARDYHLVLEGGP